MVNTQKSSNNQNIWQPDTIDECQSKTGVSFLNSEDILCAASKDFGGLFNGQPLAVAFPENTTQIASLINFAIDAKLGFTIRSKGFSQGGQTLAPPGGATLDCSQMTAINEPNLNESSLTCQPGVTWGQVVTKTAPHGLLPKVMPFFPHLTIGGVLSIGGIGGNSHLFGCASGSARELEVVTGSGQIKTCGPSQDPDLFEATLCGLGRCSVISQATISLRTFKPHMVTYYLLYMDPLNWLADLKTLYQNQHGDFLEAFCTPSLQGLHKQDDAWKPLPYWFYNLQVSFEYSQQEGLTTHQKILDSLNYGRLIHTELSQTLDFVGRYGVRAQNMKSSGTWDQPHPWFECMLPLEQFAQILPELLSRLPLALGDGLGYRIFFVGGKDQLPQSFRIPATDSPIIGFAVLPVSIPEHNRPQILDSLESIHDWLTSLGGKRCLAGWLGSNPSCFWKNHYNEYYDHWKTLKDKYDPHNVLQSVLLNTAFQRN